MTFKNTLKSLVIGAVAFGVTSCGTDYSQYNYDKNGVKFEHVNGYFTRKNILTQTRTNGDVIKSVDKDNDQLLDYVVETINDSTTTYDRKNDIGAPVVKKQQKNYSVILKRIKTEKIAYGIKHLK